MLKVTGYFQCFSWFDTPAEFPQHSPIYPEQNQTALWIDENVTTFTVYVTGCVLEKSFFEKTVDNTSHPCFPIHVCRQIVNNTYYISQNVGVRKVLNNKSDLQNHSRSLVMAPFYRPHTISY